MTLTTVVILVMLGITGGMLSGLIGIGGGLIFVPIFDFLLQQQGIEGSELVKFTLANSFFCIFISGLITSVKQYKQNNFYFKEIIYVAFPAIITGSLLTYLVSNFSWYSEDLFKLLFIALLIYTVIKTFKKKANTDELEHPFSARKFALIGLFTGLASSLSGLGGGVVMIPLFRNMIKMDMKKAASVSIGAIPILVLPMLLVYALGNPTANHVVSWGYLTPFLVAPIAIGLLIGTSFGLKIANKVSNKTLQVIFAVLLSILIIRYIIDLLNA